MEMVSTAKMKKMQQRMGLSRPYMDQLLDVIRNVVASGGASLKHPLVITDDYTVPVTEKKILLVIVGGNRGLCGSYNTNVIEEALQYRERMIEEGHNVSIYAIGKKVSTFLNFIQMPVYRAGENPEDKISVDYAQELSDQMQDAFMSGEFDEVHVAYTKAGSGSTHKPMVLPFLPLTADRLGITYDVYGYPSSGNQDYTLHPDASGILSYALPIYLRVSLYGFFLESSFSEQFARRVAMKNATDAASDMVRELNITFNRARQAKITNEITEIVGGAAALN